MKKEVKVIFHIDLNAFYAQVAIIKDPYLANEVFVVGGRSTSTRGVITTASYKARKLGIRSGMNFQTAQNIFPKLLIVPADFKLIKEQSNLFFEILEKYSNKVLRGSIDEAYVDVTKLAKEIHPMKIAKMIQDDLNKNYNLPVSIGIAPTLFLAKMGSDLKKPLGITVIRKKDIAKLILPLPIKELFGVGIKTYPFLEEKGILTIGDFLLQENYLKVLEVMTEESYISLRNHILGSSSNVVNPSKYDIPKSISNETTFNYNIDTFQVIEDEMEQLFERTYKRLLNEKVLTKTVSIKIREANFNTITRSKTLEDYTKDYDLLKQTMTTLFYDNYEEGALRLVGVGFQNIILETMYEDEYNLFTYQKFIKR